MKKIFAISIISALTCLSLFSQNSSISTHSPGHSFDVLDYKLNLDIFDCFISPFSHFFTASNQITFKADSALSNIQLNAVNTSLVIDSVSFPGTAFTHSNDILTIQLDRTYSPGDEVSLTIYYRHNNIEDGAFFARDGFVFTDCETQGARKWFPCRDQPSDKATLDLTAKVPPDVKLGSNGRLQDSTITGSALYYHWVSKHPVSTYLMVMTAKAGYNLDIVYWRKLSNPLDSIPIRFYYQDGEDPRPAKDLIGPLTTWLSQSFGEHPFEKNGFATVNDELPWSGGMENQTLTTLAANAWANEPLIVHEYAHQWFGDLITCATWADVFLNEGFATWIQAYWREKQISYQAYKEEMIGNANYYKYYNPHWAISEPGWAVNPPSNDTLFNYAITYLKGSCVLHQLRYVLGDSLFFAGLKAYATDTANFMFRSASIEGFKGTMEKVSTRDLDWFFNEWIFSPNHPAYSNTYSFQNLGDSKWKVYFTASQTQTNAGFFQMPIEVKIKFGPGLDTIIRVMNDSNNQLFGWTFDEQPTAVVFDPNNDIVLKTAKLAVGIDDQRESINQDLICMIYPNPFTTLTTIAYELTEFGPVNLQIFNQMGQIIEILIDEPQSSGAQLVRWNAEGLPPGIYYFRLAAGDQAVMGRMLKL